MNRWFILLTVSTLVGCASKPADSARQSSSAEGNAAAATATATPTPAAGEKKADAADAKVECTKGKDVRSLSVAAKDEGCELTYVKFDKPKVIATSVKGLTHCNEVRDRTRKNLESAGFTCK